MNDPVVVDASAWVELLVVRPLGVRVALRLEGHQWHAPAHVDLEMLSALGRMHRAGEITAPQVEVRLAAASRTPIVRHDLAGLVTGAWSRRENLRLADAFYVELAARLGVTVITTDQRLARATPWAEAIT